MTTPEIKVGTLVRVSHNVSRKSRVVEIRPASGGGMLYILADGGWFHGEEIEAVQDYRNTAKDGE